MTLIDLFDDIDCQYVHVFSPDSQSPVLSPYELQCAIAYALANGLANCESEVHDLLADSENIDYLVETAIIWNEPERLPTSHLAYC